MKIARVQFLGLVACLTLLAIGCTKDPVTPDNVAANRLTLNGDGYINKKFTFPNAEASYLTTKDVTVVAIGDSSVPDSVGAPGTVIFFAGMTTGIYTINDSDSDVAVWVFSDSTMYALATGTVTITKYGAVGARIEGTFSGTATTDINGNAVSVTVSEGVFSALRIADDQLDPDSLNPTIEFSFVVDGEVFDQQRVNLEQVDVAVDSATFPGGVVYRRVVAVGTADINGEDWIVTITLQPKLGPWAIGIFPWTSNIATAFTSAAITMVPEDVNKSVTFFADGTAGSTIIVSVDATTVTGVFSGSTIDGPTLKPYTISNGRFSFDLP